MKSLACVHHLEEKMAVTLVHSEVSPHRGDWIGRRCSGLDRGRNLRKIFLRDCSAGFRSVRGEIGRVGFALAVHLPTHSMGKGHR